MRTILLIARRAFTYHGRTVQPGELIQASAIEAVSLRYRGQARFAPKAVVTPPPPPVTAKVVTAATEPVQPEPPAPVADVPEPEPASPESSESIEPMREGDEGDLETLPKRRRSYKRRDLEAEG
jgi:hypothetical protein